MCSTMEPKLLLIVAACRNLGIGCNGRIPWRLKKEMGYFTKMTSKTDIEGKQNVVIMGRKTWLSLSKALPDRINVVVSRTLQELPAGAHYLVKSVQEAVDLMKTESVQKAVDKVWIVGGQEIYREAMNHPSCHRIYYTRVDADFECDTFMPEVDTDKFALITDPDVPEDLQEENGIKYKYELYEKI